MPCDELKGFFCALYSVVASVTRWLPCSHGKVSMTRWAGLTRPSSIAAAAWMAISSSMSASSMRPRNSQRVSGSTKCACERGAWYSLQATGIHHGKVGAQAVADILIRSAQFVFEQLQGQQHPDGNGASATRGALWESVGQNCARWRPPERPKGRYRPIGEWDGCQAQSRRRAERGPVPLNQCWR